jgi:hypothetical protein
MMLCLVRARPLGRRHLLRGPIGGGEAAGAAVLVDCGATHQRQCWLGRPSSSRVQQHGHDGFAAAVAIGRRVKRLAAAHG